MKILLTNHHLKDFAGSERNCLTLALGLIQRGYDVEIFTYAFGRPISHFFDEYHIKVYTYDSDCFVNKHYDLIWAHHKQLLNDCLFLKNITANKIIYSSLSPFEPLEAPPIYANLLTICLANSEETKQKMINEGVIADQIIVFPNYATSVYFNSDYCVSKQNSKMCIVSNHIPQELREFVNICNTKGIIVDCYGCEDKIKLVDCDLLKKYDCVITIGKTVQYAMAMGMPVYCYDYFFGPGWIDKDNIEKAKYYNFSGRGFERKLTAEALYNDIIDNYEERLNNIEFLTAYARKYFSFDKNFDILLDRVKNMKDIKTVELKEIFGSGVRDTLLYKRLYSTNQQLIKTCNEYDQRCVKLNQECTELKYICCTYEKSHSWKMTAPLRWMGNKFKQYIQLIKTIKINVKKTIAYVRVCGLKATLKKIWENFEDSEDYSKWYNRNKPTPEELQEQRKEMFLYMPLISVITPTFNTPEKFLREMIESVIFQTYGNWELCIADGSTNGGDTYQVLAEYAAKDMRIKIKKIGKNKGISGNSNEALNLVSGDYIALFDHDDLLTPNALYEIVKAINATKADFIYSDEDKTDVQGKRYFDPVFKPDFSPDYFKTNNYLCHFTTISKKLWKKAGYYFNSEYDGAQDYDLFLRCSEYSQHIYHISKILYHWRIHADSSASGNAAKPYTYDAGKRAVRAYLARKNEKAIVLDAADNIPNMYKIKYEVEGNPLISIIIPTCEHQQDLQTCLDSIECKSTYQNYEILVVENNSTTQNIFEYYKTIDGKNKITVLYYPGLFNYAAINNWAVKQANGQYFVFMNNDIKIITPDWMEEMLMYAQRQNIGAVGAKLLYPDQTVQHGGVILGLSGLANHSNVGINRTAPGYMGRALVVQDVSAVTAALMMVPASVFKKMKGFDERYAVAFNDVDLCMKIRAANYYIIFNPNVEAFHYESKSRGKEDTPKKRIRAQKEIELFYLKWGRMLYDPYYNENLSLKQAFTLKKNK